MSTQILLKWKNFINNTLFDENVEHSKNFQKNKQRVLRYAKRQKSMNKTSSDKSYQGDGSCILTQALHKLQPNDDSDDLHSIPEGLETSRSLPLKASFSRTERTNSAFFFEESKADNKKDKQSDNNTPDGSFNHIPQDSASVDVSPNIGMNGKTFSPSRNLDYCSAFSQPRKQSDMEQHSAYLTLMS